MGGVLDTSVLIAREQGRRMTLDRLPDKAAISTVTLAELQIGVRMSSTRQIRQRRLNTLRWAHSTFVALPVDEVVAAAFAELSARLRRQGRRIGIQDLWIAATAKAHDVRLYTQDRDFDGLPDVEVVRV